MYGLSLPLGRLTDRFGPRNVTLIGLTAVGFGAVLGPLTSDYWVMAAGVILVGVGWSCVNVAVTARIADSVPPVERGRAEGVVDSFAGLASFTLPLLGGPLAEMAGFWALAVLAVALVLASAVVAVRLAESVPGQYVHPVPA